MTDFGCQYEVVLSARTPAAGAISPVTPRSITSYNVCYTKLLRVIFLNLKNLFGDKSCCTAIDFKGVIEYVLQYVYVEKINFNCYIFGFFPVQIFILVLLTLIEAS